MCAADTDMVHLAGFGFHRGVDHIHPGLREERRRASGSRAAASRAQADPVPQRRELSTNGAKLSSLPCQSRSQNTCRKVYPRSGALLLPLAVPRGHLHPPPQAPGVVATTKGHRLQSHIHHDQNLLLLLEGGTWGGDVVKKALSSLIPVRWNL